VGITYVHVQMKHIHTCTRTHIHTHNFFIPHILACYELLEVTSVHRHIGEVEKKLTTCTLSMKTFFFFRYLARSTCINFARETQHTYEILR
jgi:hypothetical protein